MELLFLSYANSRQNPLPALEEEDTIVYSTLARRMAEGHLRLHRDSYTTLSSVTKFLTQFQDEIALFHYSGHAGATQLLLEDDIANAEGIAGLLGRCPRLRLVILNGCSTQVQVKALLQAGVPAVIATSAPVGDATAAQFAISFFRSMADNQRTLGDAFEDAMATAQTYSKQSLRKEIMKDIGLHSEEAQDSPADQVPWGLYYREDKALEWKLPLAGYVPRPDYIPNVLLIEKLIESLAPYDQSIRDIKDEEDLGEERSPGDKKKAILQCLPHPVSQQLRKLMSREKGVEDHIFYDKAGPDRLRQISHTYATMTELLAFILLADLWQSLEKKEGLQLQPDDRQALLNFLTRQPEDRKPFDFVSLIRNIRLMMERCEMPFFMKEFPVISKRFNEDSPFAEACRFLEVLRRRMYDRSGLNQEEAIRLCPDAEKQLATVCAELGFLANYSLISVRSIQVLKFRFPDKPKFNHKIISLSQTFVQLDETSKLMDTFKDSSSVLLQRKEGDKTAFLNLSPFVIDESAFDEKAELAKLFFFECYEKDAAAHRYRHIYKPGDAPLRIKDQKHFSNLRRQFDAFSQTLFQQNLQEL
jgi:hypothetical protein